MTEERAASARETYEAYLKGVITPAEVARRAEAWYASRRESSNHPPAKD